MTRTDRRRFLVLFAAIAALLALFGALALPLQAQTTPAVLVSNLGQTGISGGSALNEDFLAAHAFSVPSGGDDYTLTSIEIRTTSNVILDSEIDSLSVSVWSANSSGHPASSLHTLTNPASIAQDTPATFTAPAGATLQAGTTYVLVVHFDVDLNISQSPRWHSTESGDEDATSVTGWTIADTSLWREATDTSWSSRTTFIHGIRVNGTAGTGTLPPVSTDATLSGLTVTAGGTDLVTFASDTTDYTASVANDVAEVTVTAETTDSGASIDYLDGSDATITDGGTADGQQVTLAEGDNVIKVKVTAADTTSLTYTVTVNRAACTLNTGDLWCGVVTVGAVEDSGTTIGYGFLGTGALSDTEFSVGTNDYTIDAVMTGVDTLDDQLLFGLSRGNLTTADKAKLVLHVDGHSDPFAFSDAGGPTPNGTYTWASTGLDWSSTSEVTLRLRDTPAATTTVTIAADHAAFTATLDDVTFTLTRTEDPAAALDVAVVLTQDQTLLGSDGSRPDRDVRGGRSHRDAETPTFHFPEPHGDRGRGHPDGHGAGQFGLCAGLAAYGKHPDRGGRPGRHGVDRGDRLHVRRGRHRQRRHHRRHPPHRDRRAVAP